MLHIKNTPLNFNNLFWTTILKQIENRFSNQFDLEVKIHALKETWFDISYIFKYLDKYLSSKLLDPLPCPTFWDPSELHFKNVQCEYINGPLRYNLFGQIQNQVLNEIRQKVFTHTTNEIRYQLQTLSNIDLQIEHLVDGVNMQYFNFSHDKFDFISIAFYDFFEKIGVIKNKDFLKYKKFVIESGICDMIQFDKLCIVCSMPVKIKRDEQNRIHCENESAIEWKDGFGLYKNLMY